VFSNIILVFMFLVYASYCCFDCFGFRLMFWTFYLLGVCLGLVSEFSVVTCVGSVVKGLEIVYPNTW
jgi:hypothetical protein